MEKPVLSSDTFIPTETVKPTKQVRVWADRLGVCLSVACLIHCLLTPVLLLLLPSITVLPFFQEEGGHEYLHKVLLFILPLFALAAFIPGYFRHRNVKVFTWGLPGLICLAIGVIFFEHSHAAQAVWSVLGSLFLIRAHMLNRHLCACCESGHKPKVRRLAPRRNLVLRNGSISIKDHKD